jgi:hypothetical protein
MDLDLCCGCRRHVRATETTCPFCGAARTPGAPAPPTRNLGSPAPRSRAQRYVLGAAVVASIGIAKAGASPSEDAGSDAMAVASDPTSETAEDDAGPKEIPIPHEDQWYDRRQSNPCSGGGCCGGPVICPPYGCVFPDEACDIVHV